MPWDFFSYTIVAAVASAVGYIAVEVWTNKNVTLLNVLSVFFAVVAIITGFHLIKVAVDGDLSQLSTQVWRFHLSVAGIFGIGMALQGLIAIFKKLRQAPLRQAGADNSPPNNGTGTDANSDA